VPYIIDELNLKVQGDSHIMSAVCTQISHVVTAYCTAWLLVAILVQVLDEIYSILKSVRVSPNPPRAHELLQELRDLSSMAMEHFDEKIAPNLRDQMPEGSALGVLLSRNSSAGRNYTPSYSFRGVHSRTL